MFIFLHYWVELIVVNIIIIILNTSHGCCGPCKKVFFASKLKKEKNFCSSIVMSDHHTITVRTTHKENMQIS